MPGLPFLYGLGKHLQIKSLGIQGFGVQSFFGMLCTRLLEASKGGTKVGRMKDPLYKDSYLGITPPTFILPFEASEALGFRSLGFRLVEYL